MKKIKFYFLASFLTVLFSCKNGTNIKIINESGKELKNVIIESGFNKTNIDLLKVGEIKNVFIDFNENNSKNDGVMGLKIKEISNDYHMFGYYSNGIPSSQDVVILVKKDTVEFN